MENEMNSEEVQMLKDQEAFIEKYSQIEKSKNKETEDSHSAREPSGDGARPSKRSKGMKLSKKSKEKEKASESISVDEGKRKPSRAESWVWKHFTEIKNRDPN